MTTTRPRLADVVWRVIHGRRVEHAFPRTSAPRVAICGHTAAYRDEDLSVLSGRRCEQCETVMVTGICAMDYKFLVGHVPASVRAKRRRLMRANRGRV